MTALAEPRSNFAHLAEHDAQLLRLGLLAERHFPGDPNASLLRLRQLADLLARRLASRLGLYESADETQYELLRRLRDLGLLPREIAQLFSAIRRAGQAADHPMTVDHATALAALKMAWQLSVWFHRTLKDPGFQPGPFLPPAAQPGAATDEPASRERLAQDEEQAQAAFEQPLRNPQAVPAGQLPRWIEAAHAAAAAVQLDEAETRRLIDDQLRQTGWTVDSVNLSYANGTRPQKGLNLAIAE